MKIYVTTEFREYSIENRKVGQIHKDAGGKVDFVLTDVETYMVTHGKIIEHDDRRDTSEYEMDIDKKFVLRDSIETGKPLTLVSENDERITSPVTYIKIEQ